MKRTLEPVDVMVGIGLCATIAAGYLLFMSTNGTLGAATLESISQLSMGSTGGASHLMDGMFWVQPALGQAIVEDYLLSRDASSRTATAVEALNRATMTDHYLKTSPLGYLDQIKASAAAGESDHGARVQFVMGRAIVNFTARGIRTGVLSPAPDLGKDYGEYNRRMIGIVEAAGKKMDEVFQNHHQTALGHAIMMATRDHLEFLVQSQQRMGSAIVRVAKIQSEYRDAMAGLQEQLAAAALASIHTEEIADRFDRLASAERSGQSQPVAFSEPRSWPETPIGVLFAASLALIGVFCVGLLTPSAEGEAEAEVAGEAKPEVPGEVYRRTA